MTLNHHAPKGGPVTTIRVLSHNCWGLKYISKYRSERLAEIGNRIAACSPSHDIVGLQELWVYADYLAIRERTRHILPYGKFYHSGIFGGGLVILSRWPIQEASMFRYSLNGRPTAFFRGDWFVGKGVATAKVILPDGQALEIFNTHLHAPYEREPNDSYICHRTAQAWEIAKLMRGASERGSLVIGMGDFNMVPMSFAHVLIESRGGGVRDVWRVLKPSSSIGASINTAEAERRRRLGENPWPDVEQSLEQHGHTCDSVLNTFRWNKAHKKALENGNDRKIAPTEPDVKAKRLDYIFFSGLEQGWRVRDARVIMTERHPTLLCSLSDHFAIETTLTRAGSSEQPHTTVDVNAAMPVGEHVSGAHNAIDFEDETFNRVISQGATEANLTPGFYEDILEMIRKYTLRERQQRRWRLSHFVGSAVVTIGCFFAVWWSPANYVSFILILLSSLGLMAGTVDGLIGGLFVGSELRALNEFEWEVRNALHQAGGPDHQEKPLRDWYD